MTEYLVRKIKTCQECMGARRITHPDWQTLNSRIQAENRDGETLADTFNRLIRESWPCGDDEPPEEIPCSECEGEGKIERWIPLEQALQELGLWMPADWAERAEAEQGVPY